MDLTKNFKSYCESGGGQRGVQIEKSSFIPLWIKWQNCMHFIQQDVFTCEKKSISWLAASEEWNLMPKAGQITAVWLQASESYFTLYFMGDCNVSRQG